MLAYHKGPNVAEGQPAIHAEYRLEVCPVCGQQQFGEGKYCYGLNPRHPRERYVWITVVPVVDPDGNVL